VIFLPEENEKTETKENRFLISIPENKVARKRFESLVLRHTSTALLHRRASRRIASHRIFVAVKSSHLDTLDRRSYQAPCTASHRSAAQSRRSPVDSTDYEESVCRRAPRVVVVSSRCRGDIDLFFSHIWYVTASSLRTVVRGSFLWADEWDSRHDGTILPFTRPSQPALPLPSISLAIVEKDER
jgi:hypothetical protein